MSSIFLGGGTPSLLAPKQMERLLEAVGRAFPVRGDAEVSAEVNPDDVTLERLQGFRDAGINRISIGVQSLEPELLALLGRRHSAADACRAYRGRPQRRVHERQPGPDVRPPHPRPGPVEAHPGRRCRAGPGAPVLLLPDPGTQDAHGPPDGRRGTARPGPGPRRRHVRVGRPGASLPRLPRI